MTHHIDEFSKSLADESVPRRDTFRLLGAAVAGALLGPLGMKSAFGGGPDPCRNFCQQCPKSQRQRCLAACQACVQTSGRVCGTCSGFDCCHNAATCCVNTCCGDSQTCCGNTCCGDSQTCCGNYCADLRYDANNCGACGNRCPPYPGIDGFAICNAGACGYYLCPPGIDYNWDNYNCGRCQRACDGQSICFFGNCQASGGGGDPGF